MDAIQFAELEAFLDATRLELIKVEPRVECVTIGHAHYNRVVNDGPVEWTARAWLTYDSGIPNDLQVVAVKGSIRAALQGLHVAVRERVRKADALHQCCVDACPEEWVVTTGAGNMCAKHGMEWLASEKQAADENRSPA